MFFDFLKLNFNIDKISKLLDKKICGSCYCLLVLGWILMYSK